MPRYLMRVQSQSGPAWIEKRSDGYRQLQIHGSTGELIEAIGEGTLSAGEEVGPPDLNSILSPITTPAQVICQFANYASHLREGGRDPASITRNVMFAKAASSIGPPNSNVTRPASVTLLDYEIEIGLVIGRRITGPIDLTRDTLGEALAGIVLTNDLSARNIQIPEQQAFKGKSFRGFTPCGPILALLEPHEWSLLDTLRLRTFVNRVERQNQLASDMVFKPPQTLSELSGVMDLEPGDLILTGTPGGTALKAPSKLVMTIAKVLPEKMAMAAFLTKQASKREYLRPGDEVRCEIATDDGAIDLGEQNFTIAKSS